MEKADFPLPANVPSALSHLLNPVLGIFPGITSYSSHWRKRAVPWWAFSGDDSCSKGCDVLLEQDNIWFPSSFSMLIRVWVSRSQHLWSPHFINQDFVNQREAYWLLLQLKSGKPSPHCSLPHHFSHEWRGDPFMLLTVHAVIFPETIRINLSILLTLFMSPQEA